MQDVCAPLEKEWRRSYEAIWTGNMILCHIIIHISTFLQHPRISLQDLTLKLGRNFNSLLHMKTLFVFNLANVEGPLLIKEHRSLASLKKLKRRSKGFSQQRDSIYKSFSLTFEFILYEIFNLTKVETSKISFLPLSFFFFLC